jgi:hypothetical protein
MAQNYPIGAAHTPRTIVELELCNFKKNKHNSRIIISGIYKIVNNSPEVCFGTKIQCAQVGCKNLIIFS